MKGRGIVAAVSLFVGTFIGVSVKPAGASESCMGKAATIVGTKGPDRLEGTRSADVIVGLGGNDVITALAGNDTICGGAGNDKIKGAKGHDRIQGQGGNDTTRGGPGDDRIYGGDGSDLHYGGPGDDLMDGGEGQDTLSFKFSPDPVTVDLVEGTATGEGEDAFVTIEIVAGSRHGDTLLGDAKDNTFYPLGGDDHVDGREGYDFVVYAQSPSGVVVDLAAQSSSGGEDADVLTSLEGVVGTAYDDELLGDDFDNALYGLGGNDSLDGRGGEDTLVGGPDTDSCLNGEDLDSCE